MEESWRRFACHFVYKEKKTANLFQDGGFEGIREREREIVSADKQIDLLGNLSQLLLKNTSPYKH